MASLSDKMFANIGTNVYIVALTANLAAFITGTVLSWSSSQVTKLSELEDNPLGRTIDNSEAGWLSSLPSIGGIIGPLIYGFIMEKTGKKLSICLIGPPFLIAYTMNAFASTIWVFYLARLIAGIGAGATFLVVCVYMAEIAQDSQRGLLVSSTTMFILIGILFCYCMGPFTSIRIFNLTIAAISIVFAATFFVTAPESPYYLVSKNRNDEAEDVLRRLRNTKDVSSEIEAIKKTMSSTTEQGSIKDIFRSRAALLASIIGISLVVFQQLSGINVILAYTEQIFKETNSSLSPAESSIVVGVVQVATSPISPFLADKFGRKILLLFSCCGCFLAQTGMGTFFFVKDQGKDVSSMSWVPIVCLVLYIAFFNSGFSSLPWTIIAEVFPSNVKSLGSSLSSISYWITGFLLTYFFNDITKGMGMGPVFWLFGGLCVVTFMFVYFVLPETKGKSMNEIQDILAGK